MSSRCRVPLVSTAADDALRFASSDHLQHAKPPGPSPTKSRISLPAVLSQPCSPTIASYAEQLFLARHRHLSSASSRTTTASQLQRVNSMPRPNPPPTPGSSSDIRGKESQQTAPYIVLPPAAFPGVDVPDRASTSSAASSKNGSDSSYRPASPGVAPVNEGAARKKPQGSHKTGGVIMTAGPVITKDDFTLPPPPTRSRKIIQMKPRESVVEEGRRDGAVEASATGKGTTGKRKANTGSTAAGRKIARKTAHSLIERRRRSKMNEEFGVLKDMIPACKGQDMHKLAILQASIDYLRYLEQCVSDLQAQNNSPRPPPPPKRSTAEEDSDSDEEMDDDDQQAVAQTADNEDTTSTPALSAVDRSNSLVSLPSLSQITSTSTASPSLFPTGTGARHYSISSISQASYSPYLHSNQASPAFGPQLHQFSQHPGTFGLGSPALRPLDSTQTLRQIAEGATVELGDGRPSGSVAAGAKKRSEHELDQEATAALLMLNNDRRQWRNIRPAVDSGKDHRGGNGGMSVRDLLSG